MGYNNKKYLINKQKCDNLSIFQFILNDISEWIKLTSKIVQGAVVHYLVMPKLFNRNSIRAANTFAFFQ